MASAITEDEKKRSLNPKLKNKYVDSDSFDIEDEDEIKHPKLCHSKRTLGSDSNDENEKRDQK